MYLQVLARSRFVSTEILDFFGYNMNSLYGTIIIPSKYSSSGAAVSSLGLNLSGPQSVSVTQNANTNPSIYPYTYWSGSQTSMDNTWASFDFFTFDPTLTGIPNPPQQGSNFSNSLSTGTYTVTLNDGGNNSIPWNHSSNQLGQVNVM